MAGAPAREIRAAARRQASSISSGFGVAIGVVLAVLAVVLFVVLDYQFDQASHRLVKILAGAGFIAFVLMKPRFGLFMIPIVTPFLPWLPLLKLPGINPLNVMLGAVFITWALGRMLQRRPIFRRSQLGGALGMLVALAALSIVRGAAIPTGYTYDAARTSLELFRSAVTFTVYFIALSMTRGEKERRIMAWSITLGLLGEALCTVVLGRNGPGMRAIGSIGQSNELGTFLALYTVFAAAMIPGTRNWFGKVVLLLAVAAGTFGIVLSVSRGAILALGLGLGYVGLKSSRALTALLVVVALTSPFWAPDYLKERMLGTQRGVQGTDETELEGSAQARIDTWKAVMQLITDHPLDGVGFGGLAFVLPETGDALGLEVKDSAHNTFLRFMSEMGLFGVLLFVFLLWKCWRLAGRAAKAAATRFDRQIAVGVAAATLGLAVSCAFGDRFFNILITGNFWMACALLDDIILEQREAAA